MYIFAVSDNSYSYVFEVFAKIEFKIISHKISIPIIKILFCSVIFLFKITLIFHLLLLL